MSSSFALRGELVDPTARLGPAARPGGDEETRVRPHLFGVEKMDISAAAGTDSAVVAAEPLSEISGMRPPFWGTDTACLAGAARSRPAAGERLGQVGPADPRVPLPGLLGDRDASGSTDRLTCADLPPECTAPHHDVTQSASTRSSSDPHTTCRPTPTPIGDPSRTSSGCASCSPVCKATGRCWSWWTARGDENAPVLRRRRVTLVRIAWLRSRCVR